MVIFILVPKCPPDVREGLDAAYIEKFEKYVEVEYIDRYTARLIDERAVPKTQDMNMYVIMHKTMVEATIPRSRGSAHLGYVGYFAAPVATAFDWN